MTRIWGGRLCMACCFVHPSSLLLSMMILKFHRICTVTAVSIQRMSDKALFEKLTVWVGIHIVFLEEFFESYILHTTRPLKVLRVWQKDFTWVVEISALARSVYSEDEVCFSYVSRLMIGLLPNILIWYFM